MATSDSKTASGLQMVSGMKAVAVVILALAMFSSCGVGQGEYWDGERLVDANGEALEMAPSDLPEIINGGVPQPPVNAGGGGVNPKDPGIVALPQDPIPVLPMPLDGRGMPLMPPMVPPGAPLTPPSPKY